VSVGAECDVERLTTCAVSLGFIRVGGYELQVQQRLEAFFPDRLRNHDVHPDTAIAVGAALSFGC